MHHRVLALRSISPRASCVALRSLETVDPGLRVVGSLSSLLDICKLKIFGFYAYAHSRLTRGRVLVEHLCPQLALYLEGLCVYHTRKEDAWGAWACRP